jgi:hypothetical protein
MSSDASMCLITNVAWMLISGLAIFGSRTDPQKDALFYYRYNLALISSFISMVAIKCGVRKYLGIASVMLFVPFIFLQLTEVYIVYRCDSNPNLSTFWGIDCSSLLVFREEAKLIQVFTDEMAVLALALMNMYILWNYHASSTERNDPPPVGLRKPLLSEDFTSVHSSDPFMSAEEGDASPSMMSTSSLKVIPRNILLIFFKCITHP